MSMGDHSARAAERLKKLGRCANVSCELSWIDRASLPDWVARACKDSVSRRVRASPDDVGGGYSAFMSLKPCPECGKRTARNDEASLHDNTADYYHCAGCGHLWGVRKDNGAVVPYVSPEAQLWESTKGSDN